MIKKGNSAAEEKFADIFCELYGPERGQYVYVQYPVEDIYGKHRTIDFAIRNEKSRIAFEIDGKTWHDPSSVSSDKYEDDLLKQNSLIFGDWKVYRWTDEQVEKLPDLVRDQLITFLGESPVLFSMDDSLPNQSGSVFEPMQHQEEALENLRKVRDSHQTIALVQGATGSGKSAIGILDAKSLGKRTLFLAHTKDLVEQGAKNFRELWPEVSVGLYVDDSHDMSSHVICASVQGIARNLIDFSPEDFGYIIIDECHHASADSYRRIISYFKPDFILGLSATPERADGQDLLDIFRTCAHKLDLKDAVEAGILCPVRCIRIKTNIDLRDVRINGFRYNTTDLENRVKVPERNKLIIDTYLQYVKNKSTVVFCTSVRHAEEIAQLFTDNGVAAQSISGSTPSNKRHQILQDYEKGKIPVLCACDLLNEGWDSPHTEVLFMARPTMSKTIYLQQLGRGMRKCPGKEFLMVFDFVDNFMVYNASYSMHRLFEIREYHPGETVLGKKGDNAFDRSMFKKGRKPDVLIDYPIHAVDYETLDIFNWQNIAKGMYSQLELTRHVSAQSETITRYIKNGKISPDLSVPIGDSRMFYYFDKKRVPEYCKEFGWKEITQDNMKQMFIDMAQEMTMSYSYKPVFLKSFLSNMNEKCEADLETVSADFAAYYKERTEKGLDAEKKTCIFTKGDYTPKDVERLILNMPFKRFEDMGFMEHSKYIGIIKLNRHIASNWGKEDTENLYSLCDAALSRYFNDGKQ